MLELEKKFLKTKLGSIISFSVDLKEFSTIKIGTIAFAVCKPKNEKELKLCIKTLKAIGLKFRIIGNCSNILFSSNLSHLVLISTVELIGVKIDIKKQELTACCGEKLSTCFSKARDLGLSGFESLAFIPATVGGAIVNNASRADSPALISPRRRRLLPAIPKASLPTPGRFRRRRSRRIFCWCPETISAVRGISGSVIASSMSRSCGACRYSAR